MITDAKLMKQHIRLFLFLVAEEMKIKHQFF